MESQGWLRGTPGHGAGRIPAGNDGPASRTGLGWRSHICSRELCCCGVFFGFFFPPCPVGKGFPRPRSPLPRAGKGQQEVALAPRSARDRQCPGARCKPPPGHPRGPHRPPQRFQEPRGGAGPAATKSGRAGPGAPRPGACGARPGTAQRNPAFAKRAKPRGSWGRGAG